MPFIVLNSWNEKKFTEAQVNILETARLVLRRFTLDDAAFILELLNEKGFIQNIGDKGVRTLKDACDYIQTGPQASYKEYGFGPIASI